MEEMTLSQDPIPLERRYPTTDPLSREAERRLIQAYQAGDKKAEEELIRANLRFTISVAKEYQGSKLPLEDLISEGILGMYEAMNRFDSGRGSKLISYMVWWIRQKILQAIAEQSRVARPPLNQVNDLQKIEKKAERLRQQLSRDPTIEELAEEVGLNRGRVQRALALPLGDVSLDAPLRREDPHGDTFGDYWLVDEGLEGAPDQAAEEHELQERLQQLLDRLTPRERQIMTLYLGLDGEEPQTLEAIGERFNLTRERIRQLKEKALEKMRRWAEKEEEIPEGWIKLPRLPDQMPEMKEARG